MGGRDATPEPLTKVMAISEAASGDGCRIVECQPNPSTDTSASVLIITLGITTGDVT